MRHSRATSVFQLPNLTGLAAVGVGQSMYELAHYTRVNNLGTAVLLEAMIADPGRKLAQEMWDTCQAHFGQRK